MIEKEQKVENQLFAEIDKSKDLSERLRETERVLSIATGDLKVVKAAARKSETKLETVSYKVVLIGNPRAGIDLNKNKISVIDNELTKMTGGCKKN